MANFSRTRLRWNKAKLGSVFLKFRLKVFLYFAIFLPPKVFRWRKSWSPGRGRGRPRRAESKTSSSMTTPRTLATTTSRSVAGFFLSVVSGYGSSSSWCSRPISFLFQLELFKEQFSKKSKLKAGSDGDDDDGDDDDDVESEVEDDGESDDQR